MSKQGRPVEIQHRVDVNMYVVKYADRVKGGHYYAAQFDSRDSTREEVENWCKEKGLVLK